MQGSVRKKGTKWYYSIELGKVDGKRKRIERAGGDTKTEAQRALRKALTEYENCGTVSKDSGLSVSDYMDYWYKEYVQINCKINTQRGYKRLIDNHIKPAIGAYKLKQLTPAVLQELVNLKYRNGFSRNYLDILRTILSGSLKMAVYPYNFIKENPMFYVKLPKYAADRKRDAELKIISLEDYNKIIDRFPFGTNMHMPVQIAFYTGMRAGEVMSLTWDRVNLEEKYITVDRILVLNELGRWEFSTPKTQSSIADIKIGDTLVKLLSKYRKWQLENKLKYGPYYASNMADFVCVKENGDMLTTNSLKYLSKVVNYELGIDFNFHSLRHTHATMLLEAGAKPKAIQDRLRHGRMSTTMDTYAHVTKRIKDDTVDILESVLKTKTSDI